MEKTLKIEGVDIVVDVYEDTETSVRADFCRLSAREQYLSAGRQGPNPWEEMIGFCNPLAALKKIGATVIDLAEGKPCWLEGSDERRTRVYSALLRRAGIRHRVDVDQFGDLAVLLW